MSDEAKKPEEKKGEEYQSGNEGANATDKKPEEKTTVKNKNEPEPEAKAAAAGKTTEYFEEQGEKSLENRKAGGSDVTVSLTNKTLVRFTKDHGYFKKGHEQEVSDVALAIYEKAKVIEKL